eukprot:gene5412-6264_t
MPALSTRLIEARIEALDLGEDCIEFVRIDVQRGLDHPHRIHIQTAGLYVSELVALLIPYSAERDILESFDPDDVIFLSKRRDEFKREAAGLVLKQNYSFIEASRSLSVGESALRRWGDQLQQERTGVTHQSKALTPEQQKIQKLEARIARLEREKSILKSMVTPFFAMLIHGRIAPNDPEKANGFLLSQFLKQVLRQAAIAKPER